MAERVDYQPGTHREHETRRARANRDRPELSSRSAALVEGLASALVVLEEAERALKSTPIGGQIRSPNVGSDRDEGTSTRWARTLKRRIHNNIGQLLNEYDARVEGTFQPPAKRPLVRCVYSRCAAYGKRIPQFVGPGDAIELVRCPKCDKKLTAA